MEYSALKKLRFGTMQILGIGFLGTIFLGGFLLWLPMCNTQPIKFIDALFTSTTAVCVTGLITIVPATQFTLIGKIILLILIQIGGLGVIACTIGFFIILKKRITVRERVVIQETYNLDKISGMVAFIIRVIKGTFLVEGIGAVFYSFQFIPEFGLVKGIWYSVFHSISAFCNAGIDILGDSSFVRYVDNPLMNFTTMALIIVSGIGFTVWSDIRSTFKEAKKKNLTFRKGIGKLTLHSKLALLMTLILIFGGTLIIFLLEYNNPNTMADMSFGEKLMASAFHSVSTRTAGFATVSQSGLHSGTKFITCILMFIGGSPGGTAGGVKTTTIAMLAMVCITVIHGRKDTECFGRKLSVENFRTGFSVVMLAMVFLITGTTLLAVVEPTKDFLGLLYEASSAIGTVGLTADLTPTFGNAAKTIVMIMMYIGRIGPVTIALLFSLKKNPKKYMRELPEQRIMVG